MQCANCGNMLTPGSTYCPACGAAAAAPATPAGISPDPQPGEGGATQPESIPVSSQQFRARTAFYGRYGARGNAALPVPSSLTLPTSRPPGDEVSSAPTLTSAAVSVAAPAVSQASAAPAASQTSAAPVPRLPTSAQLSAITLPLTPGHRRPLAGRLVALGGVLLLLALLVGSGAFGYNAYRKAQVETRAAATAAARLRVTATAAAQATASASALLFSDSLATNTNGWIENGASAFFADGQYHLHNPSPTMTFDSYYQQQVFDNFKAQITVTAYTDANPNADVPYAYGLILRADPNTPADKYVFFVSPAGTYNFARHDASGFENNGWSDLTATAWASSSAIHTGKGATNTLTVIASDNTFTLFINGQQVEVVTDANASYQSGWIGVMVEGADMEAGFSGLQVYGPGA